MVIKELVTLWGFDIDQKPLKELDAGINMIQSTLKTIGYAVAGATTAIGYLLHEAGEDEQTRIAFETMLGSATLAEQKLKELKEFALRTPFELKGLKQSSKQLLAYGFSADELIPTLGALGDISSGVGKDKLPMLILALGQVRAAGKLTGAELRQFTENGVPMLEQLAKVTGKPVKSIQKMVSDGQIGFDTVQKALFALTQEGGRFFNLMEKQSKSFLGMWSNIMDWAQMLAVDIGNSLLPMAKELFTEFLNWAKANRELIKTNAIKFFKDLSDMVFGLVSLLKACYLVLNPIAQLFGGWGKSLNLVMKAFVGIMGLGLVYGLGLIAQGAYGLGLAMQMMGMKAMWAQVQLMAMPLAIGAILVAIALIAEDLIAFAQGRESVFGIMMAGIDNLFTTLKEKFGFFGELGAMLITVLLTPIRAIINGFRSMIELIDVVRGKKGFKEAVGNIADYAKNTFLGTGSVTGGLGAMGKVNSANAAFEAGNNPMVGLGGGIEEKAKAAAAASAGAGGVNNKIELNVTGVDPAAQMEMIKGTFAEELNGIMRGAMRDGETMVER